MKELIIEGPRIVHSSCPPLSLPTTLIISSASNIAIVIPRKFSHLLYERKQLRHLST